MARPLIAVSAAIEELPTAFGPQDCTKLTTAYTDAVYDAGGRPVVMPVVVDPPDDLLNRMDGLVLTGGGDIDPAFYGEAPDPSVYGVRSDRDVFEAALYREALEIGLPILAICRGMQLMNLLHGGSLIQEIESGGHWQENPASESSHEIDVATGSTLAAALGEGMVGVNSFHHQALRELGEGLRVSAMCGDVVEAVEAIEADVVAVQWHPEHMVLTDHRQRALFESFVARAGAATPIHTHEEIDLCPTT